MILAQKIASHPFFLLRNGVQQQQRLLRKSSSAATVQSFLRKTSPSRTTILTTTTKLCESILGLPAVQPQPSSPDWRRRRRRRPSLLQRQKIAQQKRRERIQELLHRRWKNGRIKKNHVRDNPDDCDFLAFVHTAVSVAYAVLPESMMDLPTSATITTNKPSTTTLKRLRPFRIAILLKQHSIQKLAEIATVLESRQELVNEEETIANNAKAERIRRSIQDTPLYLVLLYHVPSPQEREQYCNQVYGNGESSLTNFCGNNDSAHPEGRMDDTISVAEDDFGAFLLKYQEENDSSHSADTTTSSATASRDEMINLSWTLAACQNLKLFWRSKGYVCMVQQPEYLFTEAFHELVRATETERVAAILKIGAYDPRDRDSKWPFGYSSEVHRNLLDVIDVS